MLKVLLLSLPIIFRTNKCHFYNKKNIIKKYIKHKLIQKSENNQNLNKE